MNTALFFNIFLFITAFDLRGACFDDDTYWLAGTLCRCCLVVHATVYGFSVAVVLLCSVL